jgi:hypothetical protein
VLDSFSSGTTNLLNDPQKLTIGSLADASNPDPNDGSYYNGYDGEVDDLQVYSGVLSSNEVAQLYSNPGSTIGQAISVPLVARYNFEVTNNAGIDSSGNGNDANCGTGDGGTNLDTFSTDAAVGLYARLFKGDTGICFNPGSTTFNNLSNALYGSFSWSAWIKTTNSVNTDYANAYFGAPILFDYNSSENSAIFSITGTKAAFRHHAAFHHQRHRRHLPFACRDTQPRQRRHEGLCGWQPGGDRREHQWPGHRHGLHVSGRRLLRLFQWAGG